MSQKPLIYRANIDRSLGIRAAALSVVIAAGLAGVIGSGGGGGGGSIPPADFLEITSANAADVAGVVVATVYASFDLADAGDLAGGTADGAALALDRAVLQPLRDQGSDVFIQEVVGPITEDCLVTGTLTLSADLSDPFTISVGDRISAEFANCDDGDDAVTDGQLVLVIRAIQGDPLTDAFLLRADVSLTNFAVTESGETTSADGGFELTLDSLDYPVEVTRLVGESLTGTADGDTRTLTNFNEAAETNLANLPYPVVLTAGGTLASRVLDGKVDFATPVPIAGPAGDAPDTGEILITGRDGATIRIVVLNPDQVELRVDLDGNGSADEVQATTWAALGGTVAPGVTAANAQALAGEATAAAVTFQQAVRDAGFQFSDAGAFGDALSLAAVPGAFGPVSLVCLASTGPVTVSGELAMPDTFSAGDVLNGNFANCIQNPPAGQFPLTGIFVNGSLATTVTAYSGFGGFFTVAFDGVANLFQGASGTISATYNRPEPTIIRYAGSSPVVQLTGGRALYAAVAEGEYDSSGSPTRLTRTISGDFYTALIAGRYVLTTPVPLIINPNGGPNAGELLLKADNGTSVRIVALDSSSARLDIDVDGNGSVDESVVVPWAEL